MRFSLLPDRTSYSADCMAAEGVFEVDKVSGTVRIRDVLDYLILTMPETSSTSKTSLAAMSLAEFWY